MLKHWAKKFKTTFCAVSLDDEDAGWYGHTHYHSWMDVHIAIYLRNLKEFIPSNR